MGIQRAAISINIFSILAALGDLTNGPRADFEFNEVWGDGTTSRKVETMLYDSRSLSSSTDEDIDFKTALDGQGTALGFAEMRLLVVSCPTSNVAGIKMTPSATDGWTTFLSASGATDTPEITIMPGAFIILGAPIDASYAVAASNDSLNFENLSGASAGSYTILALGVKS